MRMRGIRHNDYSKIGGIFMFKGIAFKKRHIRKAVGGALALTLSFGMVFAMPGVVLYL